MRARAIGNLVYQTTRCSFYEQEKNSALGILWHLLNPLAMTLILYAVFSGVSVFAQIPHYPLYILAGLIQFNFFTQATSRAAEGLIHSRELVLNSAIPLEILVVRAVCVEGLTYAIEIALAATLIGVAGPGLSVHALTYVVVVAGMLMLTLGCALLLAGLVPFSTDLVYIWGVATRMLFFLTPVLYDPKALAGTHAAVLVALNPLADLVMLGRRSLLEGAPMAGADVMAALLVPGAILTLGWTVFVSVKGRVPDYL